MSCMFSLDDNPNTFTIDISSVVMTLTLTLPYQDLVNIQNTELIEKTERKENRENRDDISSQTYIKYEPIVLRMIFAVDEFLNTGVLEFYKTSMDFSEAVHTLICPGCSGQLSKSPITGNVKLLFDFLLCNCPKCANAIHIRICQFEGTAFIGVNGQTGKMTFYGNE
jgi:hypothetical protein